MNKVSPRTLIECGGQSIARQLSCEHTASESTDARYAGPKDVHRAVMQAVKISDERRMEEEKQKAEMQERARQPVGEQLQEMVSAVAFVQYACVFESAGQPMGEARSAKANVDGMEDLRTCLHRFARGYPRVDMKRAFIEDRAGTVVLAGMPEGRVLMVVADGNASLGGASVSVGKLVSRLTV